MKYTVRTSTKIGLGTFNSSQTKNDHIINDHMSCYSSSCFDSIWCI